jgi:hypothetical protein
MRELNLTRIPAHTQWWKRRATFFKIAASVSLLIMLSGCTKLEDESPAGRRDHLLGWFKLPECNEKKEIISGSGTLIPVFKRDGIYYSVCRGVEIPLKPCPEGFECMGGTKIGYDAATKTYYLAVVDALMSNFTDGRYGTGEKESLMRIKIPSGLLDATTRRPRTHDDFIGCFQPVWFPVVRIEIRKDGDQYVSQEQEFSGPEPGSWTTRVEPEKVNPLSDPLGFTFGRDGNAQLVYNEDLKRFELVMVVEATPPAVLRMPLARVSISAAIPSGKPPSIKMGIGIPTWH